MQSSNPQSRYGQQPTASTPRRSDWDRRDPHGFLRMAIVFVGAFVGAFVLWPLVRSAVIPDQRYAAPAAYGDYLQPVHQGRRRHDR